MKNHIQLILAFLIVPGVMLAQNSLSGSIKSKSGGEILVGATIYFPDLRKGTTTNLEGNYNLQNLPKGKYLAEVKYISHTSVIRQVEVSGDTKIDFEMEPAVAEVSTVIITGVSSSTEARLNPIPTLVVDKDILSQKASTNIIDAIASEPGISQVTTGSAISKPVIRGMGYNRIVTLNNGIRQEGQQWGDEHGIEIDEYSVDKVEIIKGPGSLMYGSDALAGVINFLPVHYIPEGKIYGDITANYQTNNNLNGLSISNSGNLGGWDWQARLSRKEAGNFSNSYDGKVFNSGSKELNFNLMTGLNRKWGYSHIYVSSFNQRLGLVTGDRDDSGNFVKQVALNDSTVTEESVNEKYLEGFKIDVPSQHIRHFRATSSTNVILGESRITANFGFQRNNREEFGNVLDPEEREIHIVLNTINYDIKYFFPEVKGFKNTIGLNGMQQSNHSKGEEMIIPEYNLFDAGLFFVSNKQIGKLNLTGGFRADNRSLHTMHHEGHAGHGEPETEELEKNFFNFSGSLGGSLNFNKSLLMKANIARGFRAPNLSELSSDGSHVGALQYELGNAALSPETSFQTDLGITYIREHITFDINGFHNLINNYIHFEKLLNVSGGDSIMDPQNPVRTLKYTQSNARLFGGEAVIDIHPHPLDWLHFENTFALVYAQNVNTNADSMKFLPFIPAPVLKSLIRANILEKGKKIKDMYFKVEGNYFFAQNRVFTAFDTETATPGYFLLSAGTGFDVMAGQNRKLFSFYIAAGNILDKSYQSHLNRLKYAPENVINGRTGVFNMGRNISFKLIVPIDIKK